MKKYPSLIILFLVLFVSACNKVYYPQVLQGCVENGTYRTRIGYQGNTGCLINMLVPQAYNYYNVHFLATREVYGKNYTFVSMGPTVNDETIYRVMVVCKSYMPMRTFKRLYLPLMTDMGARGYDRQFCKMFEGQTIIDCRPATYEIYRQDTPGMYLYYNRRQPGDIMLTHAFYFIDYGRFGVIIWIQTNSESSINSIDNKNRYRLLNQTWLPEIRFLRGFTIFCKARRCGEDCRRPWFYN